MSAYTEGTHPPPASATAGAVPVHAGVAPGDTAAPATTVVQPVHTVDGTARMAATHPTPATGLPAVEAAKLGAASSNIEGTGVHHAAVANELGMPTRSREEHEALQAAEETAGPERPQDRDTGGMIKQHDAAEGRAADPETYNVWTHPDKVPKQVVKGLDNDDLWKLIRRFDKQMYHVKACADGSKRGSYPEEEFDLINSPDEEFSPDRLRSNLERLYMTFVVGSAGFVKHIARIRSWNEFNRTASWCAAYFVAFAAGQIGLLLLSMMMLCMLYRPARHYLFPPAPLAMVSAASGGLQKPKAGDALGSKDSLTGAAEAHKGEAVENEASNFVNGIASVAMASAIGKAPEHEPEEKTKKTKIDKILPDPTDITTKAGEGKDKASGSLPTEAHNKAKDPVIDAMWKGMRPAMRGIEDFCDNYERLCNALEPTAPYPMWEHKLRVTAVLVPVLFIFVFVKMQYLARGFSFIAGVAFFSQPYLTKAWHYLNENYPDWPKYLEVQNTLLKGIPSDQQLTITLLRLGEMHDTPLPPPPMYTEAPPERAVTPELEDNLPPVNPETAERDLTHDSENYEEHYAGYDHDSDATLGDKEDDASSGGGKKKHRFLGFLKGTAKTGVTAVMGADRIKASAGSTHSKERQGVLRKRQYVDGPSMFKCRYGGKKGWLYIVSGSTSATTPCVSFSLESKNPLDNDLKPQWSYQIEDIAEMKKVGGLGWKSKLIVGSVLGMEVVDALSFTTRHAETINVTALPRRDELFNRLVALSTNRWDSY